MPVSCWSGWRRHSWPGRTSWSGWPGPRRYCGPGAVAGAGTGFDHRDRVGAPLHRASTAGIRSRGSSARPSPAPGSMATSSRPTCRTSCAAACFVRHSRVESLAVLRERHPRSREVGTPVFLASARTGELLAPDCVRRRFRSARHPRNPSGEPPGVRRAGTRSRGHPGPWTCGISMPVGDGRLI